MSESPLDSASSEVDEEVPELSDEPDNAPDDAAEYQAVPEAQDPEGTERPEVDKHPEEG
jgi:hypothetical protein